MVGGCVCGHVLSHRRTGPASMVLEENGRKWQLKDQQLPEHNKKMCVCVRERER